jgi:mannose-6-phosphate isomerase-like protein (cupin superfamily)
MLGGGESGWTFELSVANAKPKAGPPEHIHEDVDEAFYVVNGSFRAKVGDQIVAPITHKYKVRTVGPPLSSSAQQTEPGKP